MRLLLQIGLVALGSALGGVTRWGLGTLLTRLAGSRFPVATFLINVTGCLLLGWFAGWLRNQNIIPEDSWLATEELRLLVAVGFCGGYTTFSSYGLESDNLFRAGESWLGLLYVIGSVVAGLVAVRLGAMLAG